MAFIDGTVVNVALPIMQQALRATVSDAQWIVDAYLLVLSSLLLAGGSLGDRLGRRRVFGAGVLLFTIASIWCGAAPNAPQLIAARALQGLGAAFLVPGSLAIISATFPAAERGKAIGTWSALTSLSIIAGPLLGGVLVESVSWRAVFFINIPIGLVTLWVVLWRMPGDEKAKTTTRIDWAGTILICIALGGITFGLIEGPTRGWNNVAIAAIAGVVALVAFVIVERRTKDPIVPLSLFRSRTFTGANILTLFLYASLSAAMFLLPFNLIQLQGYSPSKTGATFLPFVVSMSLLSRWTGALADRIGARIPLVIGPLVTAGGFALLALPSIGGSYWTTFFPGMLALGIGMSITVAPLTTTVMTSIEEERYVGAASGINNTVSRAAGLLAIALFGAIASMVFARTLDTRLAARGVPPQIRATMAAQASRLAEAKPPAQAPANIQKEVRAAVATSFLRAYRVAMLLAAALAAVSAGGALLIAPRKRNAGVSAG